MTQSIDLGGLPPPDIIEALDYEQIIQQLKQQLTAKNPDYAEYLELESEPLTIAIEAFAYRELLLRQRINEAVRSNLLAFAQKADLEQLAAFYGVTRQLNENDESLRLRIKDRILGSSTAGGEAHYRYQAISSSQDIRDVAVDSPEPGKVRVSVLAKSGVEISPLLEKVKARVTAADVQVLTDTVEVVASELVDVHVKAEITPKLGALPVSKEQLATQLAADIEEHRGLGWDLAPSWLIRQLHGSNIQEVKLLQPTSNIVIAPNQCINLAQIDLQILPANG